jgi:hypothetical protein
MATAYLANGGTLEKALRNYLKTPGVNKMLWLSKLTFRLTLNSRVSARPAGMRTRTDDRIGEERQQPGSR